MKSSLVTGAALALAVLAGATGGARASGVHARLGITPWFVSPGDTITVEARVTRADAEFNAFDLVMAYDPAFLTFLPTSPVSSQRGTLVTGACTNTFHIFTPDTASVSVSLALLCNGVSVTGPGVIYRVRFVAGPVTGVTAVRFGSGTRFFQAGFLVTPLERDDLVMAIGQPVGVPAPPEPAGLVLGAPWPNPVRPGETLHLDLALDAPENVAFGLYDVAGRAVMPGIRRMLGAGRSPLTITPPSLSPGIYFLMARTESGRNGHLRVLVRR